MYSVENYINQNNTKKNLILLRKLVDEAIELLKISDIDGVGKLLDKSWKFKKEIPNISNQLIDEVYSKAIENGALCGKLLGAGKGGFMFFICKNGWHEKLVSSLYPLVTMDIDIENEGSKLIYSN